MSQYIVEGRAGDAVKYSDPGGTYFPVVHYIATTERREMGKSEKRNQVGNKDVGTSGNGKKASKEEQMLEQGLEESMAGSDPVSLTQPTKARGPNN